MVWREKYVKKDGSISWRVRWRRPGGEKDSQAAGDRAGRASFLAKRKANELLDDAAGLAPSRTWSQFAADYEEYSATHTRPNNHKNFTMPALKSFGAHVGAKQMQRIEFTDCERWKMKLLREKYSPTTIRMWRDALVTAFNYAIKLKLVKANPFQELEIPDEEDSWRYVPDEESRLILAEAPEPLYRCWLMGVSSGLREGEILSMTPENVRVLQGVEIVQFPSRSRKSKKPLWEPINEGMRQAMGPRPRPGERYFPYSRYLIAHQMTALVRRLKLPPTRFHDSRHTFATNYLKHGRESELIEMKLWADYQSLKRYAHPQLPVLAARMAEVRVELPQRCPKKQEPPAPGRD